MTLLLLTAEAATVFGATVWVLLRLWTRSREINLSDVVFYDYLAKRGQSLAGSSQTDIAPPRKGGDPVGLAASARASGARVGIKLPYSPSAGPQVISGARVEGFERSPLGAVVAAINLASRLAEVNMVAAGSPAPDIRCGEVVLSGAPSTDKSDIQREAGKIARGPRPGPASAMPVRRPPAEEIGEFTSSGSRLIEVSGWRMDHYSSENAVIRYVLTRSGGGDGVVTTAMRVEVNWVDDDWKVVTPPAGDWSEAFSTDIDASGFIPFPVHSSLPSPAR